MIGPTKDPRTGRFANTLELLNRTPVEQWADLPISDSDWSRLWAEDALPLETPMQPGKFGVNITEGW